MEATSLEDAVDSIIAPPPEEYNSDEVEADAIEDDDDQAEEVSADAEDQDDADVDSDDEDYEIDEDQLEANEDQPDYFTVKVDGREETVTLDQLKQNYSGQKAIQSRFQEVAEMRKQVEAAAQQTAQERQQFLQQVNSFQQADLTPPSPPSREMFESDPIGYMEQKLKYDEAYEEYQGRLQQFGQLQQQQQEYEARMRQQRLAEETRILSERIPELGDPDKYKTYSQELVSHGLDYGFSQQEMEQVTDHRYILALNDAMKWRQLQKRRATADKKSQNAQPVVKPGAKKSANTEVSARKKAQQRFRKSGSIDDALSLLINPKL